MKSSCSNSKFCAVPWNELVYTSQYNYGICCKWDDDSKLVPTTESLDSHYNSKRMKDLRQRMIRGEAIPECKNCWDDEDNGKFSMRMRRNQHYHGVADLSCSSPEVGATLEDTANDGGYNTTNLHSIHVSTGDKCQLRCIDCSPAYSKSIIKDYQKLGWDHNFKSRRIIASDRTNSPDFEKTHWESIKKSTLESERLEIIRLSGGEPSINRYFIDYLNWLVDQGIAKNIEILIPTNCVNIKNSFIEPLRHFKKTTLALSVDGIGELDEYLRYPTNWDKKLEHINTLSELFPSSSIYSVIYSLNVLDIDKIYHWGQQYPLVHSLELLAYPDELSVRHLPDNLKQLAIDKIKDIIKTINSHDDIYSKEQYALNSLSAIIKRLEEPGNSNQWAKCQNIINSYDTIRKRPLKEICQDLEY